jgi:hypothetical protein
VGRAVLCSTGKFAGPFRKEEDMSEERFEQDENLEKEEDVEAHRRAAMANDEPTAEDESDDVEAHARRASHKNL